MTHSHDSTLIQRMGFSDPDRKLPEHDKACMSLAVTPSAMLDALSVVAVGATCEIEKPLQKGDGKYATTIGFVDAMISHWTVSMETFCDRSWNHQGQSKSKGSWVACEKCGEYERRAYGSVLVEVKTSIVSIGDVLRQMNLYREYVGRAVSGGRDERMFVIWSLDRGDASFAPVLSSQGYRLVVGADLEHLEVIA